MSEEFEKLARRVSMVESELGELREQLRELKFAIGKIEWTLESMANDFNRIRDDFSNLATQARRAVK